MYIVKLFLVLFVFTMSDLSFMNAQNHIFPRHSGELKKDAIKHLQFVEKIKSEKISKGSFIDLYKEFTYQEWTGSEWVNISFEISELDTAGEEWTLTSKEMAYIDGKWVNQQLLIVKTTPFEGETGRILSSNTYVWIEEKWVNFTRMFFEYSGELLNEIIIEIAVSENDFVPFNKYEYEYNEWNMVISEIIYFHDESWIYSYRTTLEYNDEKDLTSVQEFNWGIDGWQDTIHTYYAYNGSDLLEEEIVVYFYEGEKLPYIRILYEYNDGGKLLWEKFYSPEGSQWEFSARKFYEYNEFTLPSCVTTEVINGSIFVMTERESYTYNDLMLETERLYEEYNGSGWVNKSRYLTNYTITSVDEGNHAPESFTLGNNYPNPFNPSTIISYSIPVNSKVVLKVYNLTGEEVKVLVDGEQSAGSYKANFNAAGLASGIYFYKLTADSKSETKKMILMK